MIPQELIRLALDARKNAYAPYSGFAVGAALLCADGAVYTGCNVENASSPVGCCAERTALFKAVSEGHRAFTAIAVAGDKVGREAPLAATASPCGMCRQALSEFGGGLVVYTARGERDFDTHTLEALLPHGFRL